MQVFRPRLWGCAVAAVLLLAGRGTAQGPTISSSSVGYIDPAIPASMFRLRFDAAYNDSVPDRGGFLMPRTLGAGLPLAESRVDYQDLSAYLEYTLEPRFSLFAEVPFRMMNPEVNKDYSGLSDVSAGFKWALIYERGLVTTLQCLIRAPTGDGRLGLGVDHVTVEPALLAHLGFDNGFTLESEFHFSTPIGGEPGFTSNVIRYGLGLGYDLYRDDDLMLTPVVEAVGWTFLDGKKTLLDADDSTTVVSASGDTIVNLKAGLRFGVIGFGDLYVGYGRALTGTTRYADIYRVEWRLLY